MWARWLLIALCCILARVLRGSSRERGDTGAARGGALRAGRGRRPRRARGAEWEASRRRRAVRNQAHFRWPTLASTPTAFRLRFAISTENTGVTRRALGQAARRDSLGAGGTATLNTSPTCAPLEGITAPARRLGFVCSASSSTPTPSRTSNSSRPIGARPVSLFPSLQGRALIALVAVVSSRSPNPIVWGASGADGDAEARWSQRHTASYEPRPRRARIGVISRPLTDERGGVRAGGATARGQLAELTTKVGLLAASSTRCAARWPKGNRAAARHASKCPHRTTRRRGTLAAGRRARVNNPMASISSLIQSKQSRASDADADPRRARCSGSRADRATPRS